MGNNCIYQTNGDCPLEDFLNSLSPKDYAKVTRATFLLEEYGLRVGSSLIKHLEEGIWELRVKHSSNIQRVLLFHWIENKIVLTNGFTKKSQKTPRNEIDRAKRYRQDFLLRLGGLTI
jgi:phage-related protein